MTGRLISFDDGIVVFNTRYDAVVSIPAAQLISIETDGEYRVTFKSGDRLTGRLQWSDEDKSTNLHSSQLGQMVLNIDNIASMTRHFEQQTPVASTVGQEGASEKQEYGEDVSRAAPLDFLTGSTVLLSPGRYELDFGLRYNQSRQASSLMNIGYFQRSSMVAKRLSLNTTLRAGLADRLEGWVSVPLHHTYVEQVSTNEFVRETRDTRVGDISLGLQYQMLQESSRYPALSASLNVSAPTGKKHYFEIVDSWQDPLNNGSGHWVVSPGISFVRTTDPAIVFGGLNYVHAFPATISGYRVRPGWGVDAYLGLPSSTVIH
ncbi:transporter [Nitrincola sp. MINF-07-Sa-05]|uniref:transporter n=1 Tax=Nitrincola salilacus TaxID=3400273 RepID=UPI0039182A89